MGEQLIKNRKKKNYTNEEIIDGIHRSDRSVLKYIYHNHFPMIAQFVFKNSGTRDEARDIFHDALTVIFEKVQQEKFELTSNFKTYLYAICKNLWLMVLRRKKNEAKFQDQSPMTVVLDNIDDDILEQQRYKLFKKYFKTIEEDCQKVLDRFFKGESLSRIAENMGFTAAYAKKKKYICQKKLIERIENDVMYKELVY